MKTWTLTDIRQSIEKTGIFSSAPSLIDQMAHCSVKDLKPNEFLIEKGPIKEHAIYLLLEGEAEVLSGRENIVNRLSIGSLVGETSLILENERSASIRAKTEISVLVIPVELIFEFNRAHPDLGLQILEKIYKQTFDFLKKANHQITSTLDRLKNMGLFIINLTAYLSVYSALVIYLNRLIHVTNPTWITTPLILIGCILLFIRLYLTKTPVSSLGITKKNLKLSIRESLIATGLFIGLAITLITLIQYLDPGISQKFKSLIVSPYPKNLSFAMTVLSLGTYCIHSAGQEILVRGALQGMFRTFLTLRYGNGISIALASLVFACIHAYFGIETVLVIFVIGLFWGYLYSRTGNIFGVILSHIIIGSLFLGNGRWFLRWLYNLM